MENLTIIYYSSNTECPRFEERIVENLKKQAGDIPIISVSHKPMGLGKNICIGERPVCYSNLWKQQLIGLREAKTEFCITAEADCLYPPEYFTFTPTSNDRVYRYDNVWVYWRRRSKFWRKAQCEGAQMCNREYWIERLEAMLDGHKGWEPMDNPSQLVTQIFTEGSKVRQGKWTGNPVITFKTGKGISGKTGLSREYASVTSLPYWGTAEEIKNKMFK